MILLSPAKINLFFRVLRKRSDGYHEIASLFQAIDFFDTIHFSFSHADSLTCTDPALPTGPENLVMKALHVFRSRYSLPSGVTIHLEKNIPSQAGLGGGSGNAATALWGLNELAGRPATPDELIEMGAMIGSDVPFFFSSGTAYCTGRGERLEPFSLPYPLSGWIAKPPFGLSTPLVYRETRPLELPAQDPLEGLSRYPYFYNDLEPAAFRLEPRLHAFRERLLGMGFDSATMTGSGTAFFCFGKSEKTEGIVPFRSIQRPPNGWYSESLSFIP